MPLLKDNSIISAFRGMGRRKSNSRARNTEGEVAGISSIAESFMRKLQIRSKSANNVISENWNSMLPERFKGKCDFQNVRAGVIYAKTANPAQRQELQFLEKEILKKANELQNSKIKKIRFL